jgi:hypothetical protein
MVRVALLLARTTLAEAARVVERGRASGSRRELVRNFSRQPPFIFSEAGAMPWSRLRQIGHVL